MPRLINPRLLDLAAIAIAKQAAASRTKQAVQPPIMDPTMMGGIPPGAPPGPPPGMPMDPAMMGGAPPGLPPGPPPGMPMDPAMMGGAPPGLPPGPPPGPPMDPTMMGGPPPDVGGPITADSIRQIIRDEISKSSIGAPAGNGPAGPGGPVKPAKPDLAAMQMDIFQTKKMIFRIADAMGIDIPPEIMDGPNRDAHTGMPVAPGTPGSTSDPAARAGGGGGGGPPPSAIPPIEPIPPAMPVGGGEKASEYSVGKPYGGPRTGNTNMVNAGRDIVDKAAALAMLLRGKR